MKIAFIGGGHMAYALIAGFDKTAEVIVADRNEEKRARLAREFNVDVAEALPTSLVADVIVLAVRPPQALAACAQLPAAGMLVSAVAGLRHSALTAASGRAAGQVVRIMPNTPAQVKTGMTFGYAAASSVDDQFMVEQLFATVGKFVWLAEERLLDSVTAVSGSGPAYVYYIIEAMQQAAIELGIAPEVALAAVLQTLRGACAMVEASGQTPESLRAAVAVPGGTTARALAVMQEAGVKDAFARAMHACAARAEKMGSVLACPEN